MFKQLTERLTTLRERLRGIGRLTEDNIKESLQDIRKALIEADVALPVIKDFIEHIREKAVGQAITTSIRPGDALVKLVQDELTVLLGKEHSELNLRAQSPIVIVIAGLQGSGKTTTTAKLAYRLKNQDKKTVMLTSVDVYRPAAIKQLETLAQQIEVHFFPSSSNENPVQITQNAIAKAKSQLLDVLIIDTAGRLHIDGEMMEELKRVVAAANPVETLLVVDSMTGQDAANVAKTFNETINLTGVILTKTEGDARGGAALSMRQITQKPIKFMGVGEKIDALEDFYPERVSSRILGMGDIVGLVEEAQRKVDKQEAEKIAKKLSKGKRFDFNDFLVQLQQMKNMGGIKSLLGKLPGMPQIPKAAMAMADDKKMLKMEAIIQSMTSKERMYPALMNGSRKKRVADGSGTNLQDVNSLLKQFAQMQKMLKRFKGDKMQKQLKNLQNQGLPPNWRM